MPPATILKLSALMQPRSRRERREVTRRPPRHRVFCQVREPDQEEVAAGRVYDLSAKGVGMLLPCGYAPGTVLRGLLVNSAHTFALSIDMTVVCSLRLLDGEYSLGLQFPRRLTYEELTPFML